MALTEACYRLTRGFPKDEIFGLTSQIRRSAASVPATEGHGRENTKSFIQFLRIAQGSVKELETHLLIAERTGIAAKADVNLLMLKCEGLGKMLRALIRSLQNKNTE